MNTQSKAYQAARIAAKQYLNLTYKAKVCEGYPEDKHLIKTADISRANAQRWLFTYNQKLKFLAEENNAPYILRWGPEDFLNKDQNRPIWNANT